MTFSCESIQPLLSASTGGLEASRVIRVPGPFSGLPRVVLLRLVQYTPFSANPSSPHYQQVRAVWNLAK
jgi:RecA/RadA recombinase